MVLKKISRYVLENLDTVGRTAVEAAVWEGAEELLEPEYEEVAGTVSCAWMPLWPSAAAYPERRLPV